MAIFLAARPAFDCLVWLHAFNVGRAYRRWWRGQKSREEPRSINMALRKEVLVHTTIGICDAVDQANEMPVSERDFRQPLHYPDTLFPDPADLDLDPDMDRELAERADRSLSVVPITLFRHVYNPDGGNGPTGVADSFRSEFDNLGVSHQMLERAWPGPLPYVCVHVCLHIFYHFFISIFTLNIVNSGPMPPLHRGLKPYRDPRPLPPQVPRS